MEHPPGGAASPAWRATSPARGLRGAASTATSPPLPVEWTPSSWSPAPGSLREALDRLARNERLAIIQARAREAGTAAAEAVVAEAVAEGAASAAGAAALAPSYEDVQLRLQALDGKVREVADTFQELVTVVTEVCHQVSALSASVPERHEVDGLAEQLRRLHGRVERLQPRGAGVQDGGGFIVHQATPGRPTCPATPPGPGTTSRGASGSEALHSGGAPSPCSGGRRSGPAAGSLTSGNEGREEESLEAYSFDQEDSGSMRRCMDDLSQVVERLGKGLRVLALRTEQLEDDLPRVEDLDRRLQHVEVGLPRNVEDIAQGIKEFKCSLSREIEELTLCLRLFRTGLLQRPQPQAGGSRPSSQHAATQVEAAGPGTRPGAGGRVPATGGPTGRHKGHGRRFVIQARGATGGTVEEQGNCFEAPVEGPGSVAGLDRCWGRARGPAAHPEESGKVLDSLASAVERLARASLRAEGTELALAAEVDRCHSVCAAAMQGWGGGSPCTEVEELTARVGELERLVGEKAAPGAEPAVGALHDVAPVALPRQARVERGGSGCEVAPHGSVRRCASQPQAGGGPLPAAECPQPPRLSVLRGCGRVAEAPTGEART